MNAFGLLLAGAYEVRVVMLSVVLAIASAYSAFTLARHAANAPKNERNLWLAGTVGVIAVGIWAGRVILDGAFTTSWRNAAIASVILSFLASAAATAVSDKRFLSRALRRFSLADKEPEASAAGQQEPADTANPVLAPSPADLLALGATLRRASNSVLAAGDFESSSKPGESIHGLDEDAVQSEPSSTAVNSQLPK